MILLINCLTYFVFLIDFNTISTKLKVKLVIAITQFNFYGIIL